MSVNRDPILKRCRSLQIDPSHMGIFKESKRTPSRNTRKMSEYGLQLREKQRAKFIYGVHLTRLQRKRASLVKTFSSCSKSASTMSYTEWDWL